MSLDASDPLYSGDPRYPAVSRPASDFGAPAAAPVDGPLLRMPEDAATGKLAVLCEQPIHHVLEYARLYRIAERLRERSSGLHLWMRSDLDDDAVFDRLPYDAVHRLPADGDELKSFGSVLPLPPLGFRGSFSGSRAGEEAARAFQRAVAAGSPRWIRRPGSPRRLPAAPRFLVHQARFHVGDTLWLTPLLRALRGRFPGSRATVVGPPVARRLLAAEVVVYPPDGGEEARRRVLDRLAGRRFDAALFAFARRPESRWLARAAADMGVPWRINLEYFDAALDSRRTPEWATHEGWCFWGAMASPRMLLHALDPFAVPVEEDRRVEMTVTGAARRRAAEVLAEHGIDGPFVVLAPGGHSSQRWAAERFAELAGRLAEDGGRVLVTGAAGEGDLLRRLAGRRIGVSQDPLDVLAALLERARLLVANDSAPIHVAEATATATLYFAQREKLVHSHPAGESAWALYDDAGNDVAAISVEQAMAALRLRLRA